MHEAGNERDAQGTADRGDASQRRDAPERPAATGRNVKIETGARRESIPISVPHVSADAAANAPAKAVASGPSRDAETTQSAACRRWRNLPRVARSLFFVAASALSLRGRRRESSVEGMKNARSTAAARQPPAPNTAPPTTNAAIAPPSVSARARYASECDGGRQAGRRSRLRHALGAKCAASASSQSGGRVGRRRRRRRAGRLRAQLRP